VFSPFPDLSVMSLRRLIAAVALLSPVVLGAQAAPTVAVGPNTWTIDANHTASQFSVRHMMVSTVRGQFEKTSGTIEWDGKDPTTMSVKVSIDAASVDTRVQRRDDDLRSDNFFDVAKFPTITFTSKKVVAAGAGKLRMTGDLAMHGVTKEIVLDVEGPGAPIKQGQNLRVGASASVKINRHDWGLTYSRVTEAVPVVGDEITITIDIEATKRAS
jgi:polyisoprenoid-binding protein YceI